MSDTPRLPLVSDKEAAEWEHHLLHGEYGGEFAFIAKMLADRKPMAELIRRVAIVPACGQTECDERSLDASEMVQEMEAHGD